jgi:hypothetical protein
VACTNGPGNHTYTTTSEETQNACAWNCNPGFAGNMTVGTCSPCPANTYTATPGICTSCPNTCSNGFYRSGCSGSSAGTCSACNNTV